MAKNKRSNPEEKTQQDTPVVEAAQPEPARQLNSWKISDFKLQAILMALLAFIIYINSYYNEYAHDDGIVIVKNEYVQEGFAGLKSIFTKDAYDSYYRQLNTVNQLAGGRYRPLSIATFAIEQQFFGPIPVDQVDSFLKTNFTYGMSGTTEKKLVSDMHVRHLFNVFWYMGGVVILLYFLRYLIFPRQPIMALIAALIFTVHPIHTEVIANVKSRDEIMSLIFICLTFICAFKFEDLRALAKNSANSSKLLQAPVNNSAMWAYFAGALASYFLAFLSKEYAISLVFLLPLSFYLFRDYSIPKSIKVFLPFIGVIILYFIVRIKVAMPEGSDMSLFSIKEALTSKNEASDNEVLNNPYLFAEGTQKIATEISTSLNYLKLLFWPHPLSADYSYNSIPYKNFGHWQVLLSIVVHLGMIAGAIVFSTIRKQYRVIGFALAFYMVHLLLVNNLIFNIGATMGERLVYHSSVGFAIIIAWLMVKGGERLGSQPTKNAFIWGLTGMIVVLGSFKTISRNPDWKNDKTLFFQDINVVPNSVLVNGNVAAAYITMSDGEKTEVAKKHDLHTAINLLSKAIEVHPRFVAGYLNQGIAYFRLGEIDSAMRCVDSVKKNYPNYPTLGSIYALLSDHYMKNGWNKYGKFGRFPEAIVEFKKGIAIDSNNAELWYNLGGAYFSNKQAAEAISAWNMTLKINPNHQQAKMGMQAAYGMLGAAPTTAPTPKK